MRILPFLQPRPPNPSPLPALRTSALLALINDSPLPGTSKAPSQWRFAGVNINAHIAVPVHVAIAVNEAVKVNDHLNAWALKAWTKGYSPETWVTLGVGFDLVNDGDVNGYGDLNARRLDSQALQDHGGIPSLGTRTPLSAAGHALARANLGAP